MGFDFCGLINDVPPNKDGWRKLAEKQNVQQTQELCMKSINNFLKKRTVLSIKKTEKLNTNQQTVE